MSTVKATNLQHASSASNNIVLDSSGNATFAGTPVPNSSFLRNRIINGDMRIDQRNVGASVTCNNNQAYAVDRFYGEDSSDGVFTVQRVADAPTGFINSLKATITTADSSLAATQFAAICQQIEGYNFSDLGFGAAGAQTFTLSFWVKSSLTGAFGGSFRNSSDGRCYPFSYSISVANTWEYKTLTVIGDTTGTWVTDNGIGLKVWWSSGAGSTYSGTAGALTSSLIITPTGAVSVIGTLNATFQITGVQLEVGTAATPFERRQYGQELALCQRYFQKTFNQTTAPAQNAGFDGNLTAPGSVTNVSINASWWFTCPMRAVPTVTTFAPDQASANWSDQGGVRPTAVVTTLGQSSVGIRGQTSVLAGGYYGIQATASAEL